MAKFFLILFSRLRPVPLYRRLAYHIDHYDLGDISAPRYGVKPWHDKSIIAREESESNEAILLEIIRHDIPIFANGQKEWHGTAADLERVLTSFEMPSRDQAKKVLGFYSIQNCGTYMGKLAKSHPAISKKRITGSNHWNIDLGKL